MLSKFTSVFHIKCYSQRAGVFKMSSNCNSHTILPNRRVLAIQSHVVHGYVGNKSATFPLQVLGFDVDAINSVHFSNHTGYKHVKGQVLSDKELNDVFSGLQQNGLLSTYSHLLTGYIGKDSFLTEVGSIVKAIREVNPNFVYVCDPVLGDNGHLYVPESLIPIYQDYILPLSDICTPNQFEAELLTGIKINSDADAWKATEWLHEKGVKTVVISSTNFAKNSELIGFLSQKNGNAKSRHTIFIPNIGSDIVFTGVGDLFAALFLAHSTTKPNLSEALEYTVATLQAVLRNTLKALPSDLGGKKPTAQQRELKLIQSKTDIENPTVSIRANKVQ
ncbi:pyridoxal kinase isoform X2 [Sitodiplosis mosellana]|uniref:pyridoxal kinase isoform X2 n=1 Tax=Sitodiplosis mosellana TaxID=263140 RepID=UPI002444B701|nr:pyridoxal kinase isoform X2 [Sitodiplosis mosellana]